MPFSLLVLSDLHVDYPQNMARLDEWVESLAAHKADAFVLAGDVSHKLEHVDRVLAAFSRLRMPRLFVPGNHDIWIVREGREPVRDSWDKLVRLQEACERHGFVFLEKENRDIGPFTFAGTMGWYDYSYATEPGQGPRELVEKRVGELRYMDAEYARWNMPDAQVLERLLDGLAVRLAAAKKPIVFVSHHVPRRDLLLRRGHPSWDFFNAYMGSHKMESMLEAAGVKRFVFGHTHRPVALVEDGRFIINNPVGYPRQALTLHTRPFAIS